MEHYITHLGFEKAGFFGGTFDPFHLGHLNLAINLLETCKLDHIFFSPAALSPEKQGALPSASGQMRKKMVSLGIEEIPQFSLFDWELEQEGPSYTIEAIKELKKRYPNTQIHLILGEDLLQGLPFWKDVEELLKSAPPLVGARSSTFSHLPSSLHALLESKRIPIPAMDISSTQLRKRLNQKKYCGHLIPAKVLDYIVAKQIYW